MINGLYFNHEPDITMIIYSLKYSGNYINIYDYSEKKSYYSGFFNDLGLELKPDKEFALKNLVYGLMVNERASIKNIAENMIQGQSERQMNRAIHELSVKCDDILTVNFKKLQEVPGLVIKSIGVIALDEHIIPKTGKHIEGVDYFHASLGEKDTHGFSMISTHYYGGKVEYPIDRDIYRRQQELEKWGKEELYRSKN